MINHVKTLLANIGASDAEKAGLSFYVDPSFEKIRTDSRTEEIRLALVTQPVDVNSILSAVMSVISRVDLRSHLSRYDTRILERDSSAVSAFEGFDSSLPAVSFSIFSKHGVPEFLFSRTGDTYTDDELRSLKELWAGDVDGHTGLAACIFALVARLELSRKRRG